MKEKFNCQKVVLVGDGGMIKSAEVKALNRVDKIFEDFLREFAENNWILIFTARDR